MYDDDEFRTELRRARDSALGCALLLVSLGIVGVAIWRLIAWLAG